MLDHVPGLFTSTMAAIVIPRNTSSETRRPPGFCAKSLADIAQPGLQSLQEGVSEKSNGGGQNLSRLSQYRSASHRIVYSHRSKSSRQINLGSYEAYVKVRRPAF